MQTLWARAAQVRCTCGCISCSSATSAVARRTTTSTLKRGLRRADGFTVFSSTLAVSAALIDSANKDQRSQEWVKVISEAKEQIDAVEAEQQQRLAALYEREARTEGSSKDQIEDGVARLKEEDNWGRVLTWAAKQDEERALLGFEKWRGPPLSLLQSLTQSEFEQLVGDDRIFRRFYGGPDCENLDPGAPAFPLSSKKLKILQWSVQRMVMRLLLYTSEKSEQEKHLLEYGQIEDAALSHDEAKLRADLHKAYDRIKKIRWAEKHVNIHNLIESPRWPSYSCSSGQYDENTYLNTGLYELLQNAEAGVNLPSTIAEVCTRLLRSRRPPNIHTYNLLLVHFCQLERDDLVHAVFKSMQECRIRPNEITHATVLRFFTASNNQTAFRMYVRQMNGLSSGLALADPDRSISYLAIQRYHHFGIGNRKIAEKARMNNEVYSSLIGGLLKMFQRNEAMCYYRTMISEGWKPSIEMLTSILNDCYEQADFTSGYRVWQHLQQIFGNASPLAYRLMLRLCRQCGQETLFKQILHLGIQQDALPLAILDLPDHILTGDVDNLLEVANNKLDDQTLDYPFRAFQRGLKYDLSPALQLKVLSIIRDSPNTEQRQAKLSALELKVNLPSDLKRFRKAMEKSLRAIERALPELTAMVNVPVSLDHDRQLQDSLSKKAIEFNKEDTQGMTQAVYQHFKNMISHKISPRIPQPPATHCQPPSVSPMPQTISTSLGHSPNPDSLGQTERPIRATA